MLASSYRRFALFTAIGAVIWIAFLPLYELLFSWTEFVPGINWVYLPHGIRMILVLLLGPAGALGFTIGAVLYSMYPGYGAHVDPGLDALLAVVPGLAAWTAVMLTFRQWPGRSLQPLVFQGSGALDGRRLLLLAFVSAILNSSSHVATRFLIGQEAYDASELLIAMFIGDLFGALLLLYALKGCILLFESLKSNSTDNGRKAKPKSA